MLKPLGDRVVIELVESEEKTASGIVLPDSAKEKPQEGKIVAVFSSETDHISPTDHVEKSLAIVKGL